MPALKVSHILELVGELGLVVAETVRALGTDQRDQGDAERVAHRLENVVRDLHAAAADLRLVPVEETFRRMARVSRELERTTGKKLKLETRGGDTLIDKFVLDRLNDSLVHLFRNAVDHGLEPASERRTAGKADEGCLTLVAKVVGREVHLTLSDDGRGLDRTRILARARERGLVASTAEPVDEDLWPVIFEPGFSTAETVTNLSGRGVGMDVVRAAVRDLHGTISVVSKRGEGTTITLALAVSIAFLDCLVMRVGTRLVALPVEAVSEILQPSRADLTHVRDRAEACVLRLRGALVPVRDLETFHGEVPASGATRAESRAMVVVHAGKARLALPVDELYGQQQAIVKPLEGELSRIRAALGCAVLGSGEIATVLDAAALVRGAHG